jgi:4-hydroxy-2-oxoheptanedioate aldolase
MSRLRDAWGEGRAAFGAWIMLSSPAGAEMIGAMGFDYVCVDCQHGLIAYEGMRDILLAVNGLPVSPVVRVPSNDEWWIGKALDAGAEAIIVPMVNSRVDAERAAHACRFPPDGVRSYGLARGAQPLGRTTAQINASVLCFPMIETMQGLEASDEICTTPGVDGVYVGPADLALSLGLEATATQTEPEHVAAVERIRTACESAGIVPGIHTYNGAGARRRASEGFRLVTVCADAGLLGLGGATELAAAREEGR